MKYKHFQFVICRIRSFSKLVCNEILDIMISADIRQVFLTK